MMKNYLLINIPAIVLSEQEIRNKANSQKRKLRYEDFTCK